MYLCVWIEIFHAGCALTYSTSRGMISSDTLHSGCKEELALPSDLFGVPLGPLQIGLPLDDDLQLVRPPERLRQRRLLTLGRKANPVEIPAERVRTPKFREIS